MSKIKEAMMSSVNKDCMTNLKIKDPLQLAIDRWMLETGDDGSTARYKIARLAIQELNRFSQDESA